MAEDSLRQRMLGRAGTGSPVRQGGPRLGPCQGAAWRGLDVPKGSSPRDPEEQLGLGGARGLPGQTLSVKSVCVALGPSLVAQTVKNLPAVQETWVRKSPWRREWQPTPVFLLGGSQGRRSLVGYSPWSCKESDMTERLRRTQVPALTPRGRALEPLCLCLPLCRGMLQCCYLKYFGWGRGGGVVGKGTGDKSG